MTKHRVICCGVIAAALLCAGTAIGADRGLTFSHAAHDLKMKIPCTNCHAFGPGKRTMPNHQLCSICHETEEASAEAPCSLCHVREDGSVDDLAALFVDDVMFDHEPHQEKDCSDCHRNAEELKKRMPEDSAMAGGPMAPSCDLCHPDPDAGRFVANPGMPFCVDCHRTMGEARAECTICHETMTKETIPTHHAGVRISHDDMDAWATEAAAVQKADPVFCTYCHDEVPEL